MTFYNDCSSCGGSKCSFFWVCYACIIEKLYVKTFSVPFPSVNNYLLRCTNFSSSSFTSHLSIDNFFSYLNFFLSRHSSSLITRRGRTLKKILYFLMDRVETPKVVNCKFYFWWKKIFTQFKSIDKIFCWRWNLQKWAFGSLKWALLSL